MNTNFMITLGNAGIDVKSVMLALGGFVLFIVCIVGFYILTKYGGLFLQARFSGVRIGLLDMVFMWFKNVRPEVIVNSMVQAHKAGVKADRDFLEGHYLSKGNVPLLTQVMVMGAQAGLSVEWRAMGAHLLAGGNIDSVMQALIAAERAKLGMTFDRACAIDLAGRDIMDAVATSVNPRVIDCPQQTKTSVRDKLDAVAKDGIQLCVRTRVTVRTCLDRLVGGATDETIIARVGEGIVSAIGSSESYTKVLEKPDLISDAVLAKSLDSGTAYEILSIDIADIDVGENVGAKLDIDRANARKQVAQADAEKRAAEARAAQGEQEARIAEMRAKVVEAEAQIPLAIAESFRNGNLGIMDYYRLRNLQADTAMRQSVSGSSTDASKG